MESFEQKKSELDLFREEIEELKKKTIEKKEQEENYNPHFDDIKSEELTEEDWIIYEKFKDDSMTFKEFSDYRQKVFADVRTRKVAGLTDSRVTFCAWISGQISRKKWLEKFAQEQE